MPLRSFTEAEVVLMARRRLEHPLLLTMWLGVVMFCLWRGNWFYLAAGTLAVGVNLLAVQRAKEVYVRRLFVNAGVLAATGILLVEVFGRSDEMRLLVKLGDYLILIQLCKLFERKSNRDYLQMLMLSPLLVVAASLYCSQLWFALLLAVYAAMLCYTGMVFTLKRNLDAAAKAKLATESGPMSPRRVAWNVIRDWPGRALVGRTAYVLAVMLAVGAATFLAMPRIPAGPGDAAGSSAAVSGYASSVRLGYARSVFLSDRIVMTVRTVSQGDSAQASAPLYLRGRTFDQYADSRWTGRAHPSQTGAIQPAPPPEDLLAEAQELEVSMVPGLLPSLFVPPGTVHIRTSHGRWQIDSDGEAMLAYAGGEQNVDYTVYAFPHPRNARQWRHLAAMQWQGLLGELGFWRSESRAPPRVAELARQWCDDLLRARRFRRLAPGAMNLAIARRIAARLQERCTYTLDLSGSDPSRDGVEDFLFHTRRGHCEYFASAMTVMCQSLDVQARLATGFLGGRTGSPRGDRRPGTTQYVRERDAHAWTEVHAPHTGWVVVDASPARPDEETGGLWAWGKDLWQRLGFLWDRYVQGYDADARRQVAQWFRRSAGRAWSAVRSAASALADSVIGLLAYGRVDRLLGEAAIATALAALGLEMFLVGRLVVGYLRRRHRRRRVGRPEPKDLRFVQRLFDLLVRHGLPDDPHQTPLRLADRAAADLHLPAQTLRGLVALYYRMRWGAARENTNPQEIRAAEEQVAQIARMLKRRGRREA